MTLAIVVLQSSHGHYCTSTHTGVATLLTTFTFCGFGRIFDSIRNAWRITEYDNFKSIAITKRKGNIDSWILKNVI